MRAVLKEKFENGITTVLFILVAIFFVISSYKKGDGDKE